jgi:hypothetical protein
MQALVKTATLETPLNSALHVALLLSARAGMNLHANVLLAKRI